MALTKVGFIGLGSMGLGMASSLVRAGFHVQGFDVSQSAMDRFSKCGGATSVNPTEASKGVAVVVIMVTHSDQVDDVVFGTNGVLSGVPNGAAIILCSTVSPVYVERLGTRLIGEKRNISLVDAPVSGGASGASSGTLTIMASGTTEALEKARPVLSAMSKKLYIIDGGVGAGSKVKMVNQLLAGVHLAAAAEAMVLGACAGIHTRILYDIISNAAGSSWMFVDRVPQMINGDYTPHAALNIFVKDLMMFSFAKPIPPFSDNIFRAKRKTNRVRSFGRLPPRF